MVGLKQLWDEVRVEARIHQTFTELSARKVVLAAQHLLHYFFSPKLSRFFFFFLPLGDIEIFIYLFCTSFGVKKFLHTLGLLHLGESRFCVSVWPQSICCILL